MSVSGRKHKVTTPRRLIRQVMARPVEDHGSCLYNRWCMARGRRPGAPCSSRSRRIRAKVLGEDLRIVGADSRGHAAHADADDPSPPEEKEGIAGDDVYRDGQGNEKEGGHHRRTTAYLSASDAEKLKTHEHADVHEKREISHGGEGKAPLPYEESRDPVGDAPIAGQVAEAHQGGQDCGLRAFFRRLRRSRRLLLSGFGRRLSFASCQAG